jgi:hypothetical protein
MAVVQRTAGGEAASILAALTELSIATGGYGVETVRAHAERLATSVLAARANAGAAGAAAWAGERPPGLLHWQTRLLHLGDAGTVLRLAPAFGVPSQTAAAARGLLLEHLQERRSRTDGERPELLAVMLYGFGDLVDRGELDRRLVGWRLHLLLPDYIAMHHFAWSRYPLRAGWTRLQDDLCLLSAAPAPHRPCDLAALLLTLTMNFAAPGALDLVGEAGR